MAELNVQVTAGTGTGVDTFNVGSGAVGSGTEALRQAVVVGDSVTKANVQGVDGSGRASVVVRSATGSVTSPTALSTSNSTPLGSNTARTGATFWNEGAAVAYLKAGVTASTTSYSIQLNPNDYWETPFGYTGQIDGITASGTAQVRVTEYS